MDVGVGYVESGRGVWLEHSVAKGDLGEQLLWLLPSLSLLWKHLEQNLCDIIILPS